MTDIDDLDDCPEPWRSEIERLRAANERLLANAKQDRLLSFQHGTSSVYNQALHEGQDEIAKWIATRYPLVTANTPANTFDATTHKTDATR